MKITQKLKYGSIIFHIFVSLMLFVGLMFIAELYGHFGITELDGTNYELWYRGYWWMYGFWILGYWTSFLRPTYYSKYSVSFDDEEDKVKKT